MRYLEEKYRKLSWLLFICVSRLSCIWSLIDSNFVIKFTLFCNQEFVHNYSQLFGPVMLEIKKLKINDNVKNVIPRDTVSNISDVIKVLRLCPFNIRSA